MRKRYDVARTPYQRLLAYGVLEAAQESRLAELYRSLNPVKLRAQVEQALEKLWPLADKPHPPKRNNPNQTVACGHRTLGGGPLLPLQAIHSVTVLYEATMTLG